MEDFPHNLSRKQDRGHLAEIINWRNTVNLHFDHEDTHRNLPGREIFHSKDLLTKIGDQGLTEPEAVRNLKKGIEDHFQLLIEMNPPGHRLTWLDIEVENLVRNSPSVIS